MPPILPFSIGIAGRPYKDQLFLWKRAKLGVSELQ